MSEDKSKPAQKSHRSIHVRPNEAQLKRIDKMKIATGKSAPRLLLEALLDRMDLERPLFDREEAAKMFLELRRQGNNINQIATKINSGMMQGWSQSFQGLKQSYDNIRHMLARNHADRQI